MKTDFSEWPTQSLRMLLNALGVELDEYEALNNHHLRMKVPPGLIEECRVSILVTYLRRKYWAVSNELDARKLNKELAP